MSVVGGPTLLHASFSNYTGATQSFPSNIPPGGTNPNKTGAFSTNTLGCYVDPDQEFGDAIYSINLSFLYSSPTITFNFYGSINETYLNESWGLDNVTVKITDTSGTIIPEPSTFFLIISGFLCIGFIGWLRRILL